MEDNSISFRILKIVEGTIVDGVGIRTSIYFAGCEHHCEGCQNPQSWDFGGGSVMTLEQLMEIIKRNNFNVTLTGGDPLFQSSFKMGLLLREIKKQKLTIWVYTGYKWSVIAVKQKFATLLPFIDVIVDEPFVLDKRDTKLRFRGSSNQHLIDVKKSIKNQKLIEYDLC